MKKNNYTCQNCKLNFNISKNGTILCPRCYSSNVKKEDSN